jgi:alpha-L-rhamnosidase
LNKVFLRVKVWDNFGRESDWGETPWWEMGLLTPEEWKAEWITPDPKGIVRFLKPHFI